MNWESFFEERYAQARRGQGAFGTRQVRDLTLLELGNRFSLVVAVDSDGGIGPREHDVVEVSDYLLGRFAMRVPLMEILACGAVPLAAFDMLTVAMDDGGLEIVRGIRDELEAAGLPRDFPLSGSTEDNVPTTMTGVGTAVLGLVGADHFRPGSSEPDDLVLCAGVPKSGPEDEVRLDDEELVSQSQVRALLELDAVHDVLPVGSGGILKEAHELAHSAGLTFIETESLAIDATKSAGPSTCALVSIRAAESTSIADALEVPVTNLGKLVAQ